MEDDFIPYLSENSGLLLPTLPDPFCLSFNNHF
jgi:hypothetical protein